MTKIALIGMVDLDQPSGAAIHVKELCAGLEANGLEIISFTGGKKWNLSGRRIRIPTFQRRFLRQISWNLFGIVIGIYRVLRDRIDLIYSRMDPGDLVGWAVSLLTNVPLVVELNGLPSRDVELYRVNSGLFLRITRYWEKMMYRRAKHMVGARGYLRYIQKHFQVPASQCFVVPLGVNTSLYQPMNPGECQMHLSLSPDFRYVVWVGGIAPWQGLSTLIRACPRVVRAMPDVKVLIVGDGIEFSRMQQLAVDLGVKDAVLFTGHIPYNEVPYYIGASLCGVATFPVERGDKGTISALKTVSYLACGRMVITSEMDELAEEIIQYELGDVFQNDDFDQLGEKIISAVSKISSIQNYYYRAAFEFAVPSRDWRIVCKQIADFIKTV